jgi:aromatic ring hydroxylase
MSSLQSLGIGGGNLDRPSNKGIEYVIRLRALHRVLAFTGRSIDDIVNHPIVKNEVLGWYKLQKWIERENEISELEQQWNRL